jgi:hypothetical protein
MNEAGHEARTGRDEASAPGTGAGARAPGRVTGGDVRRQLDRAPGERYRQPEPAAARPSRARRIGAAAALALGSAVVTFALITFDIGPGLLVIGLAGGWLTGLTLAGGAPAGMGEDTGTNRAATASTLAALGIALGLLLDAVRAYALGGVLLPWEYALARFGVVAPLAVVLAAAAGWLRGR